VFFGGIYAVLQYVLGFASIQATLAAIGGNGGGEVGMFWGRAL
jgi:hypothetical protein